MTDDKMPWTDLTGDMPGPTVVREWQVQGFRCYIMAHAFGHCCGYVELPADHPVVGLSYDHVSNGVDVHGGLTYFEGSTYGFDTAHGFDYWSDDAIREYGGNPEDEMIRRRINGPWMDEVIGRAPETVRPQFTFPRFNWTLERVVNETSSLAMQLAELQVPGDPSELTEGAS